STSGEDVEANKIDNPIAHGPTGTSETMGKLFEALAKAQTNIVAPMFDKEAKIPMKRGGMFKFRYASLNAVQAALKSPLSENGICYLQFPTSKGSVVSIETIVGHSSGEWISRVFTLTAASSDVKDIGGCITYGKRYAIAAIFNRTPDEDADSTQVSQAYTGSEDQKRWLNDKLKEIGVQKDDMADFHKRLLAQKLPASDASLMALVEEGRKK
ncbi:MAG: ERF family protein, partial [Desulfobulbaceae bacterium]|nr:ERF family protein [Desulfobulbaceae bacterium]